MRREKLEELKELIHSLQIKELRELEEPPRFIEAKVYHAVTNDGRTLRREKLIKNGRDGSAVIIVPFLNESDVMLTIEPRIFTKETVGVGFSAGYIEPGENGIMGATRELKEETGLTAGNMIYLGGHYQDPGISGAYNEVYLALNCILTNEQQLDKDEYIKRFICHFDELDDLVNIGYLNDANTLIAYYKTNEYRKVRMKNEF